MRLFILVGLWVIAGQALAAPAEVRALQAPAWRIHGGVRSALSPGDGLFAADSIETGSGARVLLALSEGSTVKLGENATLSLASLVEPSAADGIFQGVLNVVRGAFRFTTTVVGRKRDIRARVGTATIGIRGTDVWGKHEDARDFVVLLEGHIDIERDGQTHVLREPRTLFMAPTGAAALPLAPVKAEDLGRWAQETELQTGAGQRDTEGAYRLMFKLEQDAVSATALATKLMNAGHGAEVLASKSGARTTWRAVIKGYRSEAEARAAAALVAPVAGTPPWLSRD